MNLATDSMLTISFFPDHFIIQDQHNRRMIGKDDRPEGSYVLYTTTMQADVMTTSLDLKLSLFILIMFQLILGTIDLAIYPSNNLLF